MRASRTLTTEQVSIWLIHSFLSLPVFIVSGEDRYELVEGHGDPLLARSGLAVAFMDDDPSERAVVGAFLFGFAYPLRQG